MRRKRPNFFAAFERTKVVWSDHESLLLKTSPKCLCLVTWEVLAVQLNVQDREVALS